MARTLHTRNARHRYIRSHLVYVYFVKCAYISRPDNCDKFVCAHTYTSRWQLVACRAHQRPGGESFGENLAAALYAARQSLLFVMYSSTDGDCSICGLVSSYANITMRVRVIIYTIIKPRQATSFQ